MSDYALFTDGSVNPQLRIGVGVCLLLPVQFLNTPVEEIDPINISSKYLSKYFEDTSSTRLELQTVLWGLSVYREQIPDPVRGGLRLYTDSQSVAGLSGRRESLQQKNFHSLKSGLLLANASLYQDFFVASDELGFEVIKVSGHSSSSSHDSPQRIFSLVDRGARRELGILLKNLKLLQLNNLNPLK